MEQKPKSLPARPAAVPSFRAGGHLVQPSLNRVTAGGEVRGIEPRVMHVLVCLAARPGEVVTRDELLDTVWGGTIIGEEGITVAISDLRRVFGDDARSPRFIETIRKVGYRLIADLTPAEAASPPAPDVSAPHLRRRAWLPWTAALVAAAVLLVIWLVSRGASDAAPRFLTAVPFTSYPGNELYPALSSDGTRVAFVWAGEAGDNYDIYVKQQNTESPLRLTDNPATETFPAWSPDGSAIAFVREGQQSSICVVPSIGGPERKFADVEPYVGGLDWSPDGKLLAFSAATRPEDPYLIALLSLETLEIERRTFPQAQFTCDSSPAFSPDGQTIAFVRGGYGVQRDIYLVPTRGGAERRLTDSQRQIMGLDWMRDGRHIIFAAAPAGTFGLWRVAIGDGTISWLPVPGRAALHPAVADRADWLVYEEYTFDCNIWRVAPDPQPLITSTRMDFGADFSPDGSQIAFVSSRSGSREIWVCNRDGTQARQLTALGGVYVMGPRWSPDGTRIAFSATPAGYTAVYVMDVANGIPRRLSHGDHSETSPCWSADGKSLFFSQDAGGTWQIWKMDLRGEQRELVTTNDLWPKHASRDGRYLYYLRHDGPCIWRHSLEDGADSCVVGPAEVAALYDCVVRDEGAYILHGARSPRTLSILDFATGALDSIGTLATMRFPKIAVSPDGGTLLYDRTETIERDLMLVEGIE